MEKEEYKKIYSLENSHWWYRALHESVEHSVAKLDLAHLRLLDAGCGTGGLLKSLRNPGQVYRMDVSEEALKKCRQRGFHLLIRGSVTGIPLPNESVDCIASLDVLYHSGVNNDELALREFHRVLRNSGTLILNLPAYEWLRSTHDEAIHTGRRYTRKALKKKLVASGFHVEKITYRNCFLFPIVLVWRILRLSSIRSHSGSDLFQIPSLLNRTFLQIMRVENSMMKWIDLPFGSSIFCIAKKP